MLTQPSSSMFSPQKGPLRYNDKDILWLKCNMIQGMKFNGNSPKACFLLLGVRTPTCKVCMQWNLISSLVKGASYRNHCKHTIDSTQEGEEPANTLKWSNTYPVPCSPLSPKGLKFSTVSCSMKEKGEHSALVLILQAIKDNCLTLSPPVAWTTGTVPYCIAYSWFRPQGSNLDGINNISQLYKKGDISQKTYLLWDGKWVLWQWVVCIPCSYSVGNRNTKSNPSTKFIPEVRLCRSHPVFKLWVTRSKHDLH